MMQETGNTYHLEYKSQRERLLLGDFWNGRGAQRDVYVDMTREIIA